MIIEDEPLLRRIYRRMLGDGPFILFEADCVAQATDVFERESPIHVVVVDVRLNGEDGVALARELLRRQPSLRVIICSGDSSHKVDMDPGTFEFIAKPFGYDEFRGMMLKFGGL